MVRIGAYILPEYVCAMRFSNKTMITVPLISESLLLLPVAIGMISYPQNAT